MYINYEVFLLYILNYRDNYYCEEEFNIFI